MPSVETDSRANNNMYTNTRRNSTEEARAAGEHMRQA